MTDFTDSIGLKIDSMIGQLLVVMFLFYSGYGVMESIKKKGKNYVDKIPKHRVLSTLLNFDVAVLIFIILNLILGISKPIDKILFAFTGWTSVGNSNWYIFVIVVCYLLTYIVFSFKANKSYAYRGWFLLLLTFGTLLLLYMYKTKEPWWYNTIICYPSGVLFSIYKKRIEMFIQKRYWLSVIFVVMSFIVLFNIGRDFAAIKYNILSVNFAAIIVIFTMKVKLGNRFLQYLGSNLFPLYIYQRLPMIFLATICGGLIPQTYTFLYIICCFLVTIIISHFYKFWQIRI